MTTFPRDPEASDVEDPESIGWSQKVAHVKHRAWNDSRTGHRRITTESTVILNLPPHRAQSRGWSSSQFALEGSAFVLTVR